MRIEHRLPTVSEFRTLRGYTDWGVPNEVVTQQVLNQTLSGVVATLSGQPIGMARTVGDGCLILYIQDVIIHPSHRGKGLGRRLIQSLLRQANETYLPDCTVGLFAAAGQAGFYEKLGFSERGCTEYGPGLHGILSELAKPLIEA